MIMVMSLVPHGTSYIFHITSYILLTVRNS